MSSCISIERVFVPGAMGTRAQSQRSTGVVPTTSETRAISHHGSREPQGGITLVPSGGELAVDLRSLGGTEVRALLAQMS